MSECNVCIYFDGDYADFCREKEVVGRKDYVCSECNREIPKGSKHQFASMKAEEGFDSYRTCLVCAEIRKAFCCEGEMFGGIFWSDMEDYGFPEMNSGCLSKLKTVEAKRYFAQRYREWKKQKTA